jgi:hypothetical protein
MQERSGCEKVIRGNQREVCIRMALKLLLELLLCHLVLVISSFAKQLPAPTLEEQYQSYLHRFYKFDSKRAQDPHRLHAFARSLDYILGHESSQLEGFRVGLVEMSDWLSHEFEIIFSPRQFWPVGSNGKNHAGGETSRQNSGNSSLHSSKLLSQSPFSRPLLGEAPEITASSSSLRSSTAPPLLRSRLSDSAPMHALNWASIENPSGERTTPTIQNQGLCGACWAYVAVATTTAAVHIDSGSAPTSLSVQELIDCDTQNDRGCMGGNPLFAFGYIFLNGLVAESAYPLNYGIDQNRERETCRRFGPVPPAVAHIDAFAAVRR